MRKMKPIWKRKVRKVGNELAIGLPSELKPYFENVKTVFLAIEEGKIVISTEEPR